MVTAELQSTMVSLRARRPLWARALALIVIWTLELQPAVSSAALSQSPMFTVNSVPPNVMLMFDDSGSMNQMLLNPPPGMATQTYPLQIAPNPWVKFNTVGYYNISGVRYHAANNAAYDGGWTFGLADLIRRAPAFNPLAYNPAVEYKPWNNNGTRMANAAYGGNSDVSDGVNTQIDMRNLPANMGGGTVRSKLSGTTRGWIHSTAQMRTLSSVPAGSVFYERLTIGSGAEPPAGADLFSGTITFEDPNCGTIDTYGWTCPTGAAFQSPAQVCNSGNVGTFSATRTCCDDFGTTPDTRTLSESKWFNASYPNGTPPTSAQFSQVCDVGIVYTGSQMVNAIPLNCTDTTTIEPCSGGGGELCAVTTTTCDQVPEYRWRCDYTDHYDRTICDVATTFQYCDVTGTTGSCPGGLPTTSTGPARYVAGYWTPARYLMYDGPQPGTLAERRNLNNYRYIFIDRKFGWNGASRDLIGTNPQDAVSKYFVVDAISGLPSFRADCTTQVGQDGTWCTFEQEAQNYANWFTYYRTRLFAAVAVMSDVLSNFVGPEQYMRMGYGRINYFQDALNPWNVNSVTDRLNTGGLPNVDGQANEGAVERGVRPFTVFDPPLSAVPNATRQQLFDWLFTINGQGPTPNRETLHGAGLYFARNDSQGPWGVDPGSGSEPSTDHLWCRRNYVVLATDGEWTKLPTSFGFTPQRLLERAGDFSTLNPLGSGSVTASVSVMGPTINGTDRLTNTPRTFTYDPATEPQITGGFGGSQTGTLSDVLHYYWSRDLRADLRNSIDPTTRNRAFWQHMSSYVVGYGVTASMDDPTLVPPLRTKFEARNLIVWPQVGLEDCRQLDNNVADAAIPGRPPCTLTVAPSGNRINDTLRAALSSGGDFFSANSPAALRAALDAVFSAINAENASGTAPGLNNSLVGAGNLIVQSGFFTNTWEGYVQAFDQVALLNFLIFGGVQPLPLWVANFPAPASRNIYTTTDQLTGVAFTWGNLTAAQKTALDVTNLAAASSPILNYLRGDITQELRNGGIYRNRFTTILGDVVNSSPRYSKAVDHAYQRGPAGSHTLPLAATQGFDEYRNYITYKQSTRRPIVMFGANDGMFHILDARTAVATSGQEIFAFVPRSLYPDLRTLSQPAYSHRYFVDGPVVEGDIWHGGAWKTIAVGSTGAGRPGLFAIDVTSPQSAMDDNNVLWDIVPAEHVDAIVQQDLGSVLGEGVIGSLRDNTAPNGQGRWVYITGNGVESASHQASLLIFDIVTGDLVKAIQTGDGNAGNPNGISSITPVYDGSRNIALIYAGDKRGNVWKFDLSSDTPNDPDGAGPQKGWEIYNETGGVKKPLFQATDGAAVRQPITAGPRITPHPLGGVYVGFGTGKLYETGDFADMQVQAIYMLWDRDDLAPTLKTELQSINLQEFPFDHDSNVATPDELFRRLKGADVAAYDWNDKGFYLPLIKEGGPAEGERVLAAPILDAGVMSFTTFAPTTGGDPCIPGGTSYLYRLNIAGSITDNGFAGALGAGTVGRRIQPGLVSNAPPVYEPVTVGGPTIDVMSAADVKTMLQNPKYKLSGTNAVQQGATGTCAHVGLRVDGTVARIPTVCAGLLPMRTWRPMR
jgi:type IV pilus assembly protein PilY1